MFRQIFSFAIVTSLLAALPFLSAPAHAIEIREVVSDKGIKAYLVEDYTLPLISLAFSFEGGSVQEPRGREGLTRLMASLLDEGAGEYDASSFRAALEEDGIELGFSARREAIGGGVRTVAEDREKAFEMLRLALHEPRFEDSAIERLRNAFLISIDRQKTNPDSVGRNRLRSLLFGEHPYSRPTSGTRESMEAITRDDIIKSHQDLLARDNLHVGVVGAISEAELKEVLDKVFASLPAKANVSPVSDVAPLLGEEAAIEMPVPNVSLSVVYPGVKRKSPDFFAAYLMNHILGGGGFSSRLYTAVREERGLTYGVSSSIATLEHAAFLVIGTKTRADNQEEALEVIRSQVERMASDGVTEEELETAKKFIAGSYAISNLDTSSKIARVLVALQSGDLGIDYIDRRKDYINAVTLEEVNKMARTLLSAEPTTVIVGPAAIQ